MGMGFGLVSGRQLGQPWWRNRILVNFASAGKCHPEVTHTKQVPSRSNPNEATAGPPTEPEPGRSKDWRGEAAASRLAYSGPRVALARCRGATSPPAAGLHGLAVPCSHGRHLRRLRGRARLLPRPAETELTGCDRAPFVSGSPPNFG